jgi:hypothetical protein
MNKAHQDCDPTLLDEFHGAVRPWATTCKFPAERRHNEDATKMAHTSGRCLGRGDDIAAAVLTAA